jgi:hypothetical protein
VRAQHGCAFIGWKSLVGEPSLISIIAETLLVAERDFSVFRDRLEASLSLLDEDGSTAIGSPSMSCSKTDNWTSEDTFPADYKGNFIGIMFAFDL